MDNYSSDFASDGSDFDDGDDNFCNDMYSDDDDMFSLEDVSQDELRNIRIAWNNNNNEKEDTIISEITIENDTNSIYSAECNEEIPKGASIAHHYIQRKKLVYVSFDIETAGESCGIVQISAQVFRMVYRNGNIESEIEKETFNRYVRPGDEAIWDERSCSIHGLSKDDKRITNADEIGIVWKEFCKFIDRHIGPDQKGVLVAWNGQSCDLRWIYKLFQAPRSILTLPDNLVFFMDPSIVIKHYSSCQLNTKISKLESYELGTVWKYISKKNLNGAHDSLVDTKAQTDIVTHKHFVPFLNKTKSYKTIHDIFTATEQSQIKKCMESSRDVHKPWSELNENSESWKPRHQDTYAGPYGGGNRGPSSKIIEIAQKPTSTLATIFFALFPISIFKAIVKHTDIYAYKAYVKSCSSLDRDGKPMKKKHFVACNRKDKDARHRASEEFKITLGYIIAWFGILIYHGALCPNQKMNYWREMPYGIYCPQIQNAMSRNAFEFLRRYIHFDDNRNAKSRSHPLFDPLWKIKWILEKVMNNLRNAYNAGEKLTIDESMIRYRGRAISFVQYLPKKPIKHGIKVFALYCSVTAYLLGFEVYTGKEFTRSTESSALNVVDRLIRRANLTQARGRTVCTDNWYTSVDLAKHLYEKYKWTLVGTMTPTEKKSREDHDVPFLKLSNGALKTIPRGWYREAVIEVDKGRREKYFIQCTTWRDKKQVMFLHTKLVGPSQKYQVKRHVKGKIKRVDLAAPSIQKEYTENFNAVDRNDRDSSDYTCSVRSHRWYLRIIFWLLDRVVFSCFILVCELQKHGIRKSEWQRYVKGMSGWRDFQIDLAVAIIDCGIRQDWKNRDQTAKPKKMRQTRVKPCECKRCFFCKNRETTGIYHDRLPVILTSPGSGKK